jgi:hypothetical protein
MAEVHRKIEGLCYKAQWPLAPPNLVLLAYLEAAGMKKEHKKEWAKNVVPEGKHWTDLLVYTFCTEHLEQAND